MPTSQKRSQILIDQVTKGLSIQELKAKIGAQKNLEQMSMPTGNDATSVEERIKLLRLSDEAKRILACETATRDSAYYKKNIENYFGKVTVPLGLVGPLRVRGLHANGDYMIPLATTEAALVASYNRGAKLISEVGGCTSFLLDAYVTRCPCFAFDNLLDVGEFLIWINKSTDFIKSTAEKTTKYGCLIEVRFSVEGNRVYIAFDYTTGDAAGQNMVTIATQAAYDFIKANSPVKPRYSFVEANMSGDKKASVMAFQGTRGKKVVAEVVIPKEKVKNQLHSSVDRLAEFSTTAAVGAALSGTIGVQGHCANALAALYIACGQDAACVSESAVGITRFEKTPQGDLYACVTLPNLMVGTVGGGTSLPAQKACLDILGLSGAGHANAFAEVAAGLCLAGEISISAAVVSDTFTQAHQNLARTGDLFN